MKKNEEHIEQYHLHKEHPEKMQFEIYHLDAYYAKSKEAASKPHSHSFYQILWFFKKGGKHFVDFNCYPIHDHTVFFIAKDQIHYFDIQDTYEGVLIHFNENFLLQSDVDIFLKYNVFNIQGRPCYSLPEDLVPTGQRYIQLIKEETISRDRFGYQQVIRYLLKSLLIVFERANRKDSNDDVRLKSQYQYHYLRFRELLEQNYSKGYAVSKYADLLNISTKTLTNVCNTVVAKSPSSLISERVILEAKRLLSFTSLHSNEIGYRLGFDDASYFVKYFKRYTDKSPGDYRKMIS